MANNLKRYYQMFHKNGHVAEWLMLRPAKPPIPVQFRSWPKKAKEQGYHKFVSE